ncbi:hypothetical protein TNCV_5021041 [Trichonephila clavipes]|nr:hypothetical protein TNCV_5021041 [Trichonephila clavipes]
MPTRISACLRFVIQQANRSSSGVLCDEAVQFPQLDIRFAITAAASIDLSRMRFVRVTDGENTLVALMTGMEKV